MSDTGGPEDPEVAKLREQLAAAERAAELRSELEAAKEELQAIDNKIEDASGSDQSEAPAATDATSKDHALPKSSPIAPDSSSPKGWVVLALLGVIAGVALLATQPWQSDRQEGKSYSAAAEDKKVEAADTAVPKATSATATTKPKPKPTTPTTTPKPKPKPKTPTTKYTPKPKPTTPPPTTEAPLRGSSAGTSHVFTKAEVDSLEALCGTTTHAGHSYDCIYSLVEQATTSQVTGGPYWYRDDCDLQGDDVAGAAWLKRMYGWTEGCPARVPRTCAYDDVKRWINAKLYNDPEFPLFIERECGPS